MLARIGPAPARRREEGGAAMEFHLFLPQMRMDFGQIVAKARAAEAAGFGGIAGMDHLVATGAEEHTTFESMMTNCWIAAHTERLKVSSLVLCDAFRQQ